MAERLGTSPQEMVRWFKSISDLMKEGTNVVADGREGTLIFVDNPWNLADGTPADILCKVKFENESKFFRLSEIKLSEKLITNQKKMKEQIDFAQFVEIEKQLEITLGTIMEVEKMPKSDKMLKLKVNFGLEDRTVMTNIGNQVDPEILKGRQFPFITNLKPAKIMGVESTAMIMIPSNEGNIDITESPVSGSKLL
jgi:methionine--tRNA ligase beta chain